MKWSALLGCRSSQVEEEELRSGEPCSSVCPNHFNTQPLLSCPCQDSLTHREGVEFLARKGGQGSFLLCTNPDPALSAPVTLASAIAQPLCR